MSWCFGRNCTGRTNGGLKRKEIALITEDFALYHAIIEEARSRGLKLLVLSPGEAIPVNVGAVITSEEEAERIDYDSKRIIIAGKPQATLDQALRILRGEEYRHIIIGIDPGKYPGIAIIGDGRVVAVHHISAGETPYIVKGVLEENPGKNVIVRIGHGARLLTAQIVNSLVDLGARIEMVDETGTTPLLGKGLRSGVVSDIVAAINIARSRGRLVGKQLIEPTPGEVRVVQEKSREASNGHSTIPRRLARRVAKGEITLDEALAKHKG